MGFRDKAGIGFTAPPIFLDIVSQGSADQRASINGLYKRMALHIDSSGIIERHIRCAPKRTLNGIGVRGETDVIEANMRHKGEDGVIFLGHGGTDFFMLPCPIY